jgi:hypothetical protein
MESTDIFSLAVAAVIALATMGMQPWTPQWWLAIIVASAIAVGAGLHILWKNLSNAKKELVTPYIWAPDGKVRGWLGIAMLCLVLGFGYGLLSSMKPRGTVIATTAPAPSAPTAAPAIQPCIANNEIEQQLNKKGRQLLPLTPREIVSKNLNSGNAAVAIYIGKWVKVCGKFLEAMPDETKTQHVVWVYNEIFNLYFDKYRWDSQLATLKEMQNFKAYCRIESFSASGWLVTNNCELTE